MTRLPRDRRWRLGREHLEFFGSIEGVAREEGWLAELLPSPGKLFINGDNDLTPIVAERAVYFDNGRAGFDASAVAAPASEWFLPEGSTTGSFEEQSIPDLLELQKQAAADAAVTGNVATRGIRFNKISHRSTTG